MRGTIRARKDGRLYLDFWPDLRTEGRFLWSDRGARFRDEEHARWVGEEIHRLEAGGKPLLDAVGSFRPARSKPNLISTKLEAHRKRLIEGSDIQPNTLDGYLSILRCHCDFWDELTMLDIGYDTLEQWRDALFAKSLKGKTIKSIFAFFRAFLRDHRRRNPDYVIPEFPKVRAPQPERARMPLVDLGLVLSAIAEEDLGLFLCLVYTTIRPSEGRALCIRHYDFKAGVVDVREALKTSSGAEPVVGPTKTGSRGKYPVPDDLRRWIAQHRATVDRRAPLFPNPRTGRMYRRPVPTDIWRKACEKADVKYVPLYAATKRSGLTALSEAGLSMEDIRAMARHKNAEMTREYIVEDDQARARAASTLHKLIDGERKR